VCDSRGAGEHQHPPAARPPTTASDTWADAQIAGEVHLRHDQHDDRQATGTRCSPCVRRSRADGFCGPNSDPSSRSSRDKYAHPDSRTPRRAHDRSLTGRHDYSDGLDPDGRLVAAIQALRRVSGPRPQQSPVRRRRVPAAQRLVDSKTTSTGVVVGGCRRDGRARFSELPADG
jgi:hypothetical protein